jgi:hypothetical protein
MADPLRTDSPGVPDGASDSDRDAKIEHLLLVGLDHYFAGEYEAAVNVWTRALFLDRSHAKARAYIERARSAMAEQQRESEELLHRGVDAFDRGDASQARQLLRNALDRGIPADEAGALLERLDRLDAAAGRDRRFDEARSADRPNPAVDKAEGRRANRWPLSWFMAAGIVAAALFVIAQSVEWRSLVGGVATDSSLAESPALEAAAAASLPLPRRGSVALERARDLAATGRLHEAVAELDAVKASDPEKADADQLRARLQRELIGLTSLDPSEVTAPPSPRERAR